MPKSGRKFPENEELFAFSKIIVCRQPSGIWQFTCEAQVLAQPLQWTRDDADTWLEPAPDLRTHCGGISARFDGKFS
jgi:hypothetical protein